MADALPTGTVTTVLGLEGCGLEIPDRSPLLRQRAVVAFGAVALISLAYG